MVIQTIIVMQTFVTITRRLF